MNEPDIYNCHIHTFTIHHAPKHFLMLYTQELPFGRNLGKFLSWLVRQRFISDLFKSIINNGDHNDLLVRFARFLSRGDQPTQESVFRQIKDQYPDKAKFIALPMDLAYCDLGSIEVSLDNQHAELADLAEKYPGQIFPFFAVDPRRPGIVEAASAALRSNKFFGVKIYPNLGYHPTDPLLMEVYAICSDLGKPVMSHCTSSGTWQYGLSEIQRRQLSQPQNYAPILEKYPNLRVCLAHFGGGGEWVKHLSREVEPTDEKAAWVRVIADMIRSGKYPGLFTDISYTLFTPNPKGIHIDFFDYLKVLLANDDVRKRVLFGSDYYMVDLEKYKERELSLILRSRLGEDLFFQIAHYNPKEYLGIP